MLLAADELYFPGLVLTSLLETQPATWLLAAWKSSTTSKHPCLTVQSEFCLALSEIVPMVTTSFGLGAPVSTALNNGALFADLDPESPMVTASIGESAGQMKSA